MKKVWLDAGHGGYTPGAVGGDMHEADINLAVVLKIGAILEKAGIEVLYTRKNDTYVSLQDRSSGANNKKPDIFVSVHCNSATNINVRGVETFCYKFKYRKLADCIHKAVTAKPELYKNNRGVKEASFHVIRETAMPAALIELAFISNAQDRWLLKAKQDQYAQAVAEGILDYLGMSKLVATDTPETTIKINSDTDEDDEKPASATEKQPVYHVVIGEMTSRDDAEKTAMALEKQGFKVMISVTTEVED